MRALEGLYRFYFEWPEFSLEAGAVYEVAPECLDSSSIIVLPDETRLKLYIDEACVAHIFAHISEAGDVDEAKIFKAVKVFNVADDLEFQGDWLDLLWKINAAAFTNNLLTVYLREEDYKFLESGWWDRLKAIVSPRAATLLYLCDEYYLGEEGRPGRPAIELCRTGFCPV